MDKSESHLVLSCPGDKGKSSHFGPSRRRSVLKVNPSFFCTNKTLE